MGRLAPRQDREAALFRHPLDFGQGLGGAPTLVRIPLEHAPQDVKHISILRSESPEGWIVLDREITADIVVDLLSALMCGFAGNAQDTRALCLSDCGDVPAEEHSCEDQAELPHVVRGSGWTLAVHFRGMAVCRALKTPPQRRASKLVFRGCLEEASSAEVQNHGTAVFAQYADVILGQVPMDDAGGGHSLDTSQHVEHQRQALVQRNQRPAGLFTTTPLPDDLLQISTSGRLRQNERHVGKFLGLEERQRCSGLAHYPGNPNLSGRLVRVGPPRCDQHAEVRLGHQARSGNEE
mmetsp:Transcript_38243/g.109943  ORF Transcript_38243/g.109943 Transcript_38243/m.109943 type:complete len:294 (+) Transcript_38243:279-1160(+)